MQVACATYCLSVTSLPAAVAAAAADSRRFWKVDIYMTSTVLQYRTGVVL